MKTADKILRRHNDIKFRFSIIYVIKENVVLRRNLQISDLFTIQRLTIWLFGGIITMYVYNKNSKGNFGG